jgi:hypothetical protein
MLLMVWRCSTLAVSLPYFGSLKLPLTINLIHQDIVHGDVKCENVLVFESDRQPEEHEQQSEILWRFI